MVLDLLKRLRIFLVFIYSFLLRNFGPFYEMIPFWVGGEILPFSEMIPFFLGTCGPFIKWYHFCWENFGPFLKWFVGEF